jgi:hypothetical protein
MSKHSAKEGTSCLFERPDMELVNVRFFRGGSDVICEEEFNGERAAAAARKRSGEVTASSHPPRCKQAPIDLRKVVADI